MTQQLFTNTTDMNRDRGRQNNILISYSPWSHKWGNNFPLSMTQQSFLLISLCLHLFSILYIVSRLKQSRNEGQMSKGGNNEQE